MTHISIFDKPELVETVAQYLSPQDIYNCSVTCKELAHQLEPYLWQHFSVPTLSCAGTLAIPQNALLRNRNHIRSIDIDCQEDFYLKALANGLPSPLPLSGAISSTYSLSSSSNISEQQQQQVPLKLRSITIHHLPKSNVAHHLLSVAFHCYYLTALNIPSLVLTRDTSYHELLLHTISTKLPNLEQLAFLGLAQVVLDRTASLFNVGFRHPKLIALKCWFSIICSSDEDSINILLQSIGIPSDHGEVSHETVDINHSNIKDFRLPLFPFDFPVHQFLEPLLKYRGLGLERLGIPRLPMKASTSISQIIPQYCPKLRHISLDVQDYHMSLSLIQIFQGIRILGGLVSFSARGTADQPWPTMTTYLLSSNHDRDLEEVDIMDISVSADFLNLIVRFNNLKRLWISMPVTGDDIPIIQPFSTKEWSCLDLRELCYCFNRYQGEDYSRELFYKQLGRLVKLEVLGIGCVEQDTVSIQPNRPIRFRGPVDTPLPVGLLSEELINRGESRLLVRGQLVPSCDFQDPVDTPPPPTLVEWLAGLSHLKELRHLFLMTDLWYGMTRDDVQFMDSNWPRLERITFGFRKTQLVEIVSQPHWQWLKERRPWIQYSYWSDNSSYIAKNL
ncbi:MAG: hypothetical protein J3Q66DRAFT_136676 [Benniella sp.]|nr:MAG: hypothetical protein J3Q66DRAFT_136676 [Benniella sp.]